MKKYYFIALLAIFILTACGGNNRKSAGQSMKSAPTVTMESSVPAEIDELAQYIRTALSSNGDDQMSLYDVYIEGKYIICVFLIDEMELGGMTIKESLLAEGMTEEDFVQIMTEQLKHDNIQHPEYIEPLRKYHYNMLYRFVGSLSGETINLEIAYYEFPE